MKSTARRNTAWVLLLVITLPVIGAFTWLQLEKHAVRRQVKHHIMASIEREALVKLTFQIDEIEHVLEWEHSLEFEYQGMMYDVVEQQLYADSITYWCWADEKESQLNRQLTSLSEKWFNTAPQQREKQTSLQQFLRNLFHQHETVAAPLLHACTSLAFVPYRASLIQSPHTPTSHPPERFNIV